MIFKYILIDYVNATFVCRKMDTSTEWGPFKRQLQAGMEFLESVPAPS